MTGWWTRVSWVGGEKDEAINDPSAKRKPDVWTRNQCWALTTILQLATPRNEQGPIFLELPLLCDSVGAYCMVLWCQSWCKSQIPITNNVTTVQPQCNNEANRDMMATQYWWRLSIVYLQLFRRSPFTPSVLLFSIVQKMMCSENGGVWADQRQGGRPDGANALLPDSLFYFYSAATKSYSPKLSNLEMWRLLLSILS